ncbi:site-specific integrase [bacterium 210917-SL.2.15]|nr:site-specific integrase [bacterium 210917-SL.2.15]
MLTAPQQKRPVHAVFSEGTCQSAGILISGLRIEERCAPRWKDVDLKGRDIRVRKTVQRIFYKEWNGAAKSSVVLTAPKTRSAVRDVPLASFLVPLLRELRCGDSEAYVLSGSRRCLETKTYRTLYNRFLERYSMPLLRFHGLRHTFATRCVENGADCKTVSALLRHASVSLPLNLYVHPQMEQKRKCIRRLPLYENCRAARRF